jgi:hypothetical protein
MGALAARSRAVQRGDHARGEIAPPAHRALVGRQRRPRIAGIDPPADDRPEHPAIREHRIELGVEVRAQPRARRRWRAPRRLKKPAIPVVSMGPRRDGHAGGPRV